MKSKQANTLIAVTIGLILTFSFINCGRYTLFPDAEDKIYGVGSKGVETGNPMVALPKVFIDSSFPKLPADRKILTVGAKGRQFTSCQAAVNAARPGDEVVIDAGYICRNLVLTDKGDSQDYIVIRTANLSSLPPEGSRISREN